jgi:glycosyltransferase involved in cell wall biosynthesis
MDGHSVFVLGHSVRGPRFYEVLNEGVRYLQIGTGRPENYSSPRMSVHHLLSIFRYFLETIPYLVKVIVLYDIDSIIFYREQFQAPLAIIVRLFGGKAWLAHVVIRKLRGSESFLHWLNLALLNCFSGVFTYVSYFNAGESSFDNIAELKKYLPNRVYYLPGGVDSNKIERLEPKPWMHRVRTESDFVVVCPRRLTTQKGVHILLESIPRVVDGLGGKKPLFVFAHDGELRDHIQMRSRELGVDQYVLISPEPLVGNLMCELIKCADVVVVPSLSEEDFGMAFLEAWSVRIPVISTYVGGVQGVVSDGINGLLVPPGDAIRLADAVLLLLRTPDLRRKFGESGFKMVTSRYEIRQVACELVSILDHSVQNGELRTIHAR